MGHSEYDPASRERRAWTPAGGLAPSEHWSPTGMGIRFWLDRERRLRDRSQAHHVRVPAGRPGQKRHGGEGRRRCKAQPVGCAGSGGMAVPNTSPYL